MVVRIKAQPPRNRELLHSGAGPGLGDRLAGLLDGQVSYLGGLDFIFIMAKTYIAQTASLASADRGDQGDRH
jgi:hypothetical protein